MEERESRRTKGAPTEPTSASRPLGVQHKLLVGSAHDPLEREADRVAAAVVKRLAAPEIAGDAEQPPGAETTRIHRATLDAPRLPIGPEGGAVDASTASRIRRAHGAPLDAPTRGRMEAAFNADLSAVRVHTGSEATQLNHNLGARAFTTGRDIFFGSDMYRPSTSAGQELLAHELAHTMQQTAVRRRSTVASDEPIRRTLGTLAAAVPTKADVTNHMASVQDTGRTWFQEAQYLLDIIKLTPDPIPSLVVRADALRLAMKGAIATLASEMNLFSAAANTEYDALVEEGTDLQRRYKVVHDDLHKKLKEGQKLDKLMLSNEDQLMVDALTKLKRANLKPAGPELLRALVLFKDWLKEQDYGDTFTAWVAAGKVGDRPDEPAAAILPAGVVPRSTLAAAAPNGATGGQRYAPDHNWHGTHTYHVSVSFKIPDDKSNKKRKPAQRWHRIDQFHVTFTANNNPGQAEPTKARYWWRKVSDGDFTFDNPSGGPHVVGMQADAQAAVTAVATLLGCTA